MSRLNSWLKELHYLQEKRNSPCAGITVGRMPQLLPNIKCVECKDCELHKDKLEQLIDNLTEEE